MLDGVIEVTLLTADRQTLGKAPLIFRGDSATFSLEFDGAKEIPQTESGRVSLGIFLQNAALYSLTIEKK